MTRVETDSTSNTAADSGCSSSAPTRGSHGFAAPGSRLGGTLSGRIRRLAGEGPA